MFKRNKRENASETQNTVMGSLRVQRREDAMAKEADVIPENFASIEKAEEFWEGHDTSEYNLTRVEDVKVDIKTLTLEIQLEAKIAYFLLKIADEKGVSLDELVNALLKNGLETYEILMGMHGSI